MYACYYDCYCDNIIQTIELLLERFPNIVEQKNNDGCTGYDYLSRYYIKKCIAKYIDAKNL